MGELNDRPDYIGRFAPSPTGDLHFGSLIAAVGSYLQAKANGGLWLVRIEDLDPPREVPGSASRILADLHRLGMYWDGEVLYQSHRIREYEDAWEQLLARDDAFWCACARSDLPDNQVYPGTCRNGPKPGRPLRSIRMRIPDEVIQFTDSVMGTQFQDLSKDVGDFVIRRADGMPAYQLAVIVDDAFQRVSEVVRGADLLDSTPRQICLQRRLGLPQPDYLHLPLATLSDGRKLSKCEAADPVRMRSPEDAVRQALTFLGQDPPGALGLDDLWHWAISHWAQTNIPPVMAIHAPRVTADQD